MSLMVVKEKAYSSIVCVASRSLDRSLRRSQKCRFYADFPSWVKSEIQRWTVKNKRHFADLFRNVVIMPGTFGKMPRLPLWAMSLIGCRMRDQLLQLTASKWPHRSEAVPESWGPTRRQHIGLARPPGRQVLQACG